MNHIFGVKQIVYNLGDGEPPIVGNVFSFFLARVLYFKNSMEVAENILMAQATTRRNHDFCVLVIILLSIR